MATVSAKVFRHHRKSDGSYNVKVRVFHHQKKYIETEYYVTDNHLGPDGSIKDPFVLSQLNRRLDDYRETINRLGDRIELFSAEGLRDYLRQKYTPIDSRLSARRSSTSRWPIKRKGAPRHSKPSGSV